MSHILIVDDDVVARALLRMTLEGEGYDVKEAADGVMAIKLYREEAADLIITDLFMPEKEGLEIIIELRRDFPDVKIIVVSGGGKFEPKLYLQTAGHLGALRTFTKPFDPNELLLAVREIVDGDSSNCAKS